MRSGTVMMGVGRAVPVMALGWIASDASMRALEGEAIQDQPIADSVTMGLGEFAANTYAGIGFVLGVAPIASGVIKTGLAVLT